MSADVGRIDLPKRVIFNMTAEAEAAGETLDSPNGDMALKPDWGFQGEAAPDGNNDDALQAFTRLKSLASDAIESFAAEILGNALDWCSSRLSEQTHLPMQCYTRALAAITSKSHCALLNRVVTKGKRLLPYSDLGAVPL